MPEPLDECTSVIHAALDQVNSQFNLRVAKDASTALLGHDSAMDSLAFVNFVVAVEDICAQRFGVQIALTDAAPDAEDGPAFASVGDLARLLMQRIHRIERVR